MYDGDGNRVSKTVAGVTTKYWVDVNNPTGYAQVLQEIPPNNFPVQYYYGLELLERNDTNNSRAVRYYVHDGHGSVRALTDSSGNVTDTYDYDAFGNEIHSTGTSPNNYLFAGEQFDPDLDLYYNRARYLNTNTGRFWTMDSYEGDPESPGSLHKYLYAGGNPVDRKDPGGRDFDIVSVTTAVAIGTTIGAISYEAVNYFITRPTYQIIFQYIVRDPSLGHFKKFEVQVNAPEAGIRFTVVQWIEGSYKINGSPAPGLQHQSRSIPFDLPNWQIDSFTNLAEYPGFPGATSLTKEANDILLYDAPGAHGMLGPATYEADLHFRVNVYAGGLSHGNDVSSFRSIDDPAPVLSIPWDFVDVYQVTQ